MPKFFRSISGKEIVIVPAHRELTPGTFRSIFNMAGLSLEDFDKLRS